MYLNKINMEKIKEIFNRRMCYIKIVGNYKIKSYTFSRLFFFFVVASDQRKIRFVCVFLQYAMTYKKNFVLLLF